MNKVILMGRLTADPDVRATQDGKYVASFTLAVDRKVSRDAENRADFIRIKAWEKKAEFAQKYLLKGSKVCLSGRIQTGSYTDKDGKTVYTTDIIAEDIEFADSKKSADVGRPTPMTDADGFMTVPDGIDEELPFV